MQSACRALCFVFVGEKLTAMKVGETYSSSVEASDAAATTPFISEEMNTAATIMADALLDDIISRPTLGWMSMPIVIGTLPRGQLV